MIPSFVQQAGNIWNNQVHADWEASSTFDSVGDGCTPVTALRASCSMY